MITRFCPPDYVHFMKCPEKVAINNRLVMATSAFGFISTAAVVCTLAVIYGHRKDRRSLRERILTGVFAGNLLYSVVNMIPIAVEETDAAICGDPYYVESQSLVRGLWFGAKYTSTFPPALPLPLQHLLTVTPACSPIRSHLLRLFSSLLRFGAVFLGGRAVVAYELFVIYASVVALKTGSINMARNHERAAHAACGATGLVAFALFYHAAQDSFAESVSATTYTQQIAARDEYDKLVQLTVQLWLILLGVMAVMWICECALPTRLQPHQPGSRTMATPCIHLCRPTIHLQGAQEAVGGRFGRGAGRLGQGSLEAWRQARRGRTIQAPQTPRHGLRWLRRDRETARGLRGRLHPLGRARGPHGDKL